MVYGAVTYSGFATRALPLALPAGVCETGPCEFNYCNWSSNHRMVCLEASCEMESAPQIGRQAAARAGFPCAEKKAINEIRMPDFQNIC